jgi:hypothetical protein
VSSSQDQIANELDQLWAEQARRVRDIYELLERQARDSAATPELLVRLACGSADSPRLRLVPNQPMVDATHSDPAAQAAQAATLKLVPR